MSAGDMGPTSKNMGTLLDLKSPELDKFTGKA